MADRTRKSPVKVPNLGANGIEYIEPQQAQTPQPQNGGLTSVIDQTTGQKIVMPASNIPQGQPQVVQPVVENPYADRAAAQEAVARNSQAVVEQQPNLFAQHKAAGYLSSAQPQQPVVEQKPAPVVQQPQVQKQQTQPVLDSNSSSAGMDYLNSLYTDPREEERLRKASVMNQRILAIGDAIRHIGNIANTVNYAPAQQLNSPVQEEQARYERGKALRDRANQQYYTYQQQKAAQDAAQKKWEQQFRYNTARDAANFELKKSESEARQQRQNALAELDRARLEGQIDKNTYQRLVNQYYPGTAEARIREIESRIAKNGRSGGGRSGGSGKGNTYWDYDEAGNIHYYPNKTMWEQGVESHTRGQKQQEEFKTIDGYGDQKVTYKKRSAVSKAGENAHNAANRVRNSKSNPYGDNTKKGNTQKNHKNNPYG